MSDHNDEVLFDHWCRGDRKAGQLLVQRYDGYLHRFFRRRLPAHNDDLVQQTLLSVLDSGHRFRRESSFRAYLLGTARRQLLYYLRRRRRESIDDVAPFVWSEVLSSEQSDNRSNRLDYTWLDEALRRVPTDLRLILKLAFWEGLTGPEISCTIGVPINTVYSRLRRAKKRLRHDISADESEHELQDASLAECMGAECSLHG